MQKLIVKNFRQIPYAEIEIKSVTVFIGEQASGKSTLAKLIYFFRTLKEDFFDLIYLKLDIDKTNAEEYFSERIIAKFHSYFGFSDLSEQKFELKFYLSFHNEVVEETDFIVITNRKNSENKITCKFNTGFLDNLNKFVLKHTGELENLLQGTKGQPRAILEKMRSHVMNDARESLNNLFQDEYDSLFLPAGRNITVSYSEQFKGFFSEKLFANANKANSADALIMKNFIRHTQFLQDYFAREINFNTVVHYSSSGQDKDALNEKVIKFFRNHAEYILQGKYNNEDGNEKITFGKKEQSVPLNLASSGQQESVRIVQDLFYLLLENQKAFRIIEEPEAHLYARAQKNLIELTALVVNKTDSQILLTTHSPYVLSILNNLLMIARTIKVNPEAKTRIDAHFKTGNLDAQKEERIYLDSDEIQVYALNEHAETYCKSVIDSETGLIGENYLDTVTEELNDDFNVLYNLTFQNQNHA